MDALATLPWLNAPMRRVAEGRIHQASKDGLPYVLARQKVGDDIFVLDGGIARTLSRWEDSKTKMFGPNGVCWNGNRDKTEYLVYLPGAKEAVSVGTEKDLIGKKLSAGEISLLLSINDSGHADTDGEYDYLPESRIAYHLLLSVGHIFERDLTSAAKLVEPLGQKVLDSSCKCNAGTFR